MDSLSSVEIDTLRTFLYSTAGLDLGAGKEYLINSRLGEVCKVFNIASLSSLVAQLKGGRSKVRDAVLEAMTTNETSFFRDTSPFDALREQLIPDLIKQNQSTRSLRIWSAACSTGQEPYSLAMLLRENFPELDSWNVSILGTDIAEEKVLEQARRGCYSQYEVGRGLPARLLVKYFRQAGRDWEVDPSLKKIVNFQKLNLVSIPSTFPQFDLVLCRNVLLYFDMPTKERILVAMSRHLTPTGYLMLGGSEVLIGIAPGLQRYVVGRATCYRLQNKA